VEYKKGDLVRLSDFGKMLSGEMDCNVGMVLEGPYDLSVKTGTEVTTYYIAYDILVGDEIMKSVPVDFLRRMTKNEKDIERVERVADGNKAY
jgi:hypothetical protein